MQAGVELGKCLESRQPVVCTTVGPLGPSHGPPAEHACGPHNTQNETSVGPSVYHVLHSLTRRASPGGGHRAVKP